MLPPATGASGWRGQTCKAYLESIYQGHWFLCACACTCALTYLFPYLTWCSDRDEFSFPLEFQKTLAAEKKTLQVSWKQRFSNILAFAVHLFHMNYRWKWLKRVETLQLFCTEHFVRWVPLSCRLEQKCRETSGRASGLLSASSSLRWSFQSTQSSSAWLQTSPPCLPLLPPLWELMERWLTEMQRPTHQWCDRHETPVFTFGVCCRVSMLWK